MPVVAYSGVSFTTVTVYTTPSSGTLADIFQDSGGTEPKSNPFISFGNYSFYANAGYYVLQGDYTQVLPYPAVAFADLPFSPVVGELRVVTDSNTAVWGATIAGGGANQVLAFFNGTNWTVAGK